MLLDNVTTAPPVGATADKVTVPCVVFPPITLIGLSVTDDNTVVGGAGGLTVSAPLFDVPLYAPVIETLVAVETELVVTVNDALVVPAAIVTLVGTVAAPVLLLDSDTTAPPLGAGPESQAVPCAVAPPTTLVGKIETDDKELIGDGLMVNEELLDRIP